MTTATAGDATAAPGGAQEPPSNPLTPFQASVVELVGGLTAGEVMTYAEVADEIGRPGSGQAVANVLRRVPGLPWWRVIPSSGALYRTHAPTQAPLLRVDGVSVDEEGRVTTDLDAVG
jgi:methylated-DNA-protein-cysteine methyltransferase related protein